MLFVDKYRLKTLLNTLEIELKKNNLWNDITPSSDQLLSKQPFCCDTLLFEQWLQFVFISTLNTLITQANISVFNCNIYPMADESFKYLKRKPIALMNTIKALDLILSSGQINECTP